MRTTMLPAFALVVVTLVGMDETAFSETKAQPAADESPATKNVLILVKEFSMENTEVEGLSGNAAQKVIAKKKPRLTSVLSQKLRTRLLSNGFAAASFTSTSTSSATEVLVLDGEFVRIHKDKPRMTVRVWVYHPDDPSKRLIDSDVSAVSTAGPVGMAKVAMNNLAHNVIQWLQVMLPPVIEEAKNTDVNRAPVSLP